jgi:hypothetical protein
LFFLLTYLKTYSLQVVQGRLFGMGQSTKPISGFTSCCPLYKPRLAPSAIPRLVPSRPWRSGLAQRWPTRRP